MVDNTFKNSHGSDFLSLQFKFNEKQAEHEKLLKTYHALKENYINIEKELTDTKALYYNASITDKNVKSMTEKLEEKEDEIIKLKEEAALRERQFEDLKKTMEVRYEKDIGFFKLLLENNSGKVESANTAVKLNELMHYEILRLNQKINDCAVEEQARMREREVRHETKFSDLKKKMMDHIKETQKNVTLLNIQHMDLNSKLTLLQNHQLIMELEYQSFEIEDLLKKKEYLEKKVFELQRDIEVHREVEKVLADKNKKFSDIIMKLANQSRNEGKDTDNLTRNKSLFQSHSSGFYRHAISPPQYAFKNSTPIEIDIALQSENKIKQLEKMLRKNEKEYYKIKHNYETISDKLKNYEMKYSNLFSLLENAMEKLFEDEEFLKTKEIYTNIDTLKQGDFRSMTSEQKYSILMILIKYLLPLIDQNNIESDITKQALQNVTMRYNFSKKNEKEDIDHSHSMTSSNTKFPPSAGKTVNILSKTLKIKFPKARIQPKVMIENEDMKRSSSKALYSILKM